MLRTPVPGPARALLSAAAAVLALMGTATPANADAAMKGDLAGDAPARLDITSVTYRNTTPSVSARFRVPKLTRAGHAEFAITTTGGTDVAYVAIVSSGSDGGVRTRFVSRGNAGDTQLSCAFKARWDVNRKLISIVVPRTCLSKAGVGAHYLRGDMTSSNGAQRDYGPAAPHLARD